LDKNKDSEAKEEVSRPDRFTATQPTSGFQHPPTKNPLRCTTLAAVINSALDRNFFKVLNLPDKKKSSAKISTNVKVLCYYAELIQLIEIFRAPA
jgi:hypothetical protein